MDTPDPGGRRSKPRVPLRPDQPAPEAVRAILAALAAVVSRNLDGAVAGRDPEFLHDLRVALRRSRTLLGQFRHVFDQRSVAPLLRELRWLGSATGPCRDLDIFLLDLRSHRLVPRDLPGLDRIADRVARDRRIAHGRLVRSLSSRRLSDLMERWRRFTRATGRAGGPPIGELAGQRILRAHRRLLRHGLAAGGSPSATEAHRLRIDAKKLRYLLELLAPLYPEQELGRLVRELKTVQDLLGEHHDATVQLAWLERLSGRLSGSGADATVLDAAHRLARHLERHREELLQSFAVHFARLASPGARQRHTRLLSPPPPRSS